MKHHLTVIIFFILKGFFYLFRMWQEKMLYFINWLNCFTSILLQCRGKKNFYRTAWFLYVFFCIYFSHTKESSLVLWWVWSCCYTERVFSGRLSYHVSLDQCGLSCLSAPSMACNMEPSGVESSAGNSLVETLHCTVLHCTALGWISSLLSVICKNCWCLTWPLEKAAFQRGEEVQWLERTWQQEWAWGEETNVSLWSFYL